MKQFLLNIPIRLKLYTATSLLIASVSLFILLYVPAQQKQHSLEAMQIRAQSIATMTAYTAAPAVVFHDITGMQEIFNSAQQNEDLVYILLEDTAGAVLAGDQLPLAFQYAYRSVSTVQHPPDSVFKVSAPVVSGNTRIAVLYLGLSLKGVYQELAHNRAMILMISMIIFFIGLITSYWIARLITMPLEKVVETVQKITAGDMTQRAPIIWEDEVGMFARSFNHMVNTVLSTQTELGILNRTLEDRVTHRTHLLQQKITEHERTKEELQRREKIIETVAHIAEQFLYSIDWKQEIHNVLHELGEAALVNRVIVSQLVEQTKENIILTGLYEWVSEGTPSVLHEPQLFTWNLRSIGIAQWAMALLENEVFIMGPEQLSLLRASISIATDVQSLIFAPIMVQGSWWGVAGFSQKQPQRVWTAAEIDMLKTTVRALGSAIERQQAEEALRFSEEQYRRFFDENLTANFIVLPDGTIQACNTAFLQTFEFASRDHALRTNFRSLFPSGEMFDTWIHEIRSQHEMNHHQMTVRRLSGYPVYAIVNAIGRFRTDGTLEQIQGYLYDDTKRRELEEQLLQSQKMEGLGTIAGGIAHDFNNILAIIEGYIHLLRQPQRTPDAHTRALDAITKASERGANLVRQLLAFARRTKTEFKYISVNDILQDTMRLITQTFPKTIVVQSDLAVQLPTILADATQLHQVILNICVNARDAMPDGGTLSFRTLLVEGTQVARKFHHAQADSYLQIEIQDTGIGMTDTVRKRIFEPFFTTKEIGKGTGLGLSVVFGIVQSHNGFIDVQSKLHIGTVFQFYFPVAELPVIEDSSTPAESQSSLHGTETILVVEDEDALRDFVSTALTEQGYSVLTAVDGNNGLEVFQQSQQTIQLVLTDMGLPKLSGEQMSYLIKQLHPHIPIIVASGFLEPSVITRLQKAGICHILNKPYSLTALLQLVRTALTEVSLAHQSS